MNLQNEAIEIQKILHQDYKTYWEETEAIKTYLESRFKALGLYDVSQCNELLADEKCDKLIHELDNYARNYDNYDYGLPTGVEDDDPQLKEMRLLVKNWFKANCG